MALTLFLNTECQLCCRYCFGWEQKDNSEIRLSVQFVDEVLSAFWSKGHRYVTLTGGEPFLHPEIKEIIQITHDKGFWITLLTNGLAIDSSMVSFLSNFWRLQIRVSLEAADAEKHEYFRGKGTFVPMLKNIDLMKSKGIQVNLGLTIYEENRDQIEPVVSLAIEKNCASLRVVPLVRIEKGKDARVSKELYEGILRDLIDSILLHRKDINLQGDIGFGELPVSTYTTKHCIAGIGFVGIDSDKTMLPCSLIRFGSGVPKIKFNHVSDIDVLKDSMNQYFSTIVSNQKGTCASCEFLEACRGGCVGEKLSFGLDPTDGQPICIHTMLSKIIKDYDSEKIKPIIASWVYDLSKNYEKISDGYCFRQAPFWKISFKRKIR